MRCHLSCPSISATEAPKRWRICAFSDLTSLRFPFRPCDSPKWSRTSSRQTKARHGDGAYSSVFSTCFVRKNSRTSPSLTSA